MISSYIWFVLIFIVPFIPAVVVFHMIKPQEGDAKVGGNVPLFRDLKLDLGGAIATYVVIVVFAIVAFFVINRSEAIAVSFIVEPTNSAGDSIPSEYVNWEKIRLETLSIGVQAKNGSKYYVDSFAKAPDTFKVGSHNTLSFLRADFGTPVPLELLGNKSLFLYEPTASLRQEIVVKVVVADEFLNDWIVVADLLEETFSGSDGTETSRKVLILQNGTKASLSNIRFGGWGLSGLKSMSMSARRVSQNSITDFVKSEISAARLPKNIVPARFAGAVREVFDHASSAGDVKIDEEQIKKEVPSATRVGAASIIFAPSPRASFDPPIVPGQGVALEIISVRDLAPILTHGQDDPLTVGYDYGAMVAVSSYRASGNLKFCRDNMEAILDEPGGKRVLDASEIKNTADSKDVILTNVKRGSRLSVPISISAQPCTL
ncbi:hypothetical protein [Rhizobium phaseoli]|uniref:hypothetical protein n=1 Tax=Rhizobium phaseoli TaxID=396 RepID=UPI0007EB7825|nr:hypothetical protein [Rhizobium phaseoli]